MTKKMLIGFVILVFCLPLVCGFGSTPKTDSSSSSSAQYKHLIDNFEDGDLEAAPEWFKFDAAKIKVEKNSTRKDGDAAVVEAVGAYSINVTGNTTKWYVGGMGTMLGIDASKYRSIEMDVYGNGPDSGKIKVEVYDDDNGNNDIEVGSNWVPKYDDLMYFEINVNWKGWKHVSIPFDQLTISNPGKGNGTFDPSTAGGSGGLVKVQMIFVSNTETGKINFNIDNLELGI
ncbi:MAG: hypothetical protein WC901_06845 [Candidatus Margulisiibacteriota bacterium]